MTINEMHQSFITLSRQGQGAYRSREEIDKFLNDGSKNKYNEEKRQFEMNGYISDELHNFKTSSTITFSAGFGLLPAGYDYRTNAATTATPPKKVEIVPEGEWIERINDPIEVPSVTLPICAVRDQVQIYPSSVSNMTLYYLKKPVNMVFGYTEDGDGNTIYNPGTSVDPDWPDSACPDVVLRALVYAGVALPDQTMIQAKSIKKNVENV